MTLQKEDGELFYKLWLPLLDYVNQKYRVRKKLKKMATATQLDPEDVKAVAERLYEDFSVIDEYLGVYRDISNEHRQIIESWKKSIKGQFVIERNLKTGGIFISAKDGKVYKVLGIISSFEEMFWFVPMPILVEATLMPFRNTIITDGLIEPYDIEIGNNMKKMLRDTYLSAKNNGEIIHDLS